MSVRITTVAGRSYASVRVFLSEIDTSVRPRLSKAAAGARVTSQALPSSGARIDDVKSAKRLRKGLRVARRMASAVAVAVSVSVPG